MAKLANFRRNADRVNSGDWITVGFDADNTFQICTRGQTEKFLYRLGELQRQAAREANRGITPGDIPYQPDALPAPLANRCLGRAMAEHTFIDVRGLDNDDGPVTADDFRNALLQPMDYVPLITLAYQAVLAVHVDRKAEAKDAEGNSASVSAGS